MMVNSDAEFFNWEEKEEDRKKKKKNYTNFNFGTLEEGQVNVTVLEEKEEGR